jgi:opacity protein-like surface antigen
VTWSRLAALAALAAAAISAAVATATDEPRRIALEVLVAYISDEPGGVDPQAQELDRTLSGQFRYATLRVLDQRRLDLPLGAVESVALPNGRLLNVRAFQLASRGVLLGVTVKGSLQTDLRVPNGHLVVIGTERYQTGQIVISLKPSW